MTNAVKSQILAVRDTGLTNMFDIHAVQAIAYKNDWHELVVYLEDKANRMEYSRFIMTGEASIVDEISEQDDEELSEEEQEELMCRARALIFVGDTEVYYEAIKKQDRKELEERI